MGEPTKPVPGAGNLMVSHLAVITTRAKLTTGVSNQAGNLWRTAGESAKCVYNVRTKWEEVTPSLTHRARVRAVAQIAVDGRCGNCEEHAMVTFVELKRMGVKDVEIVRFSNADHIFVVIGREPTSQINDPKTWGPDAVISDAWKGESYSAADLDKHWPGKVSKIYYHGD